MKGKLFIGLMLVTFNLATYAEDKTTLLFEGGVASLLATKNTFTIAVSDQVTGGCLQNPGMLKDKMEISLRKNGFHIKKEPDLSSNNIIITALGFKFGETSCAVHLSVNLIYNALVAVPYVTKAEYGYYTFAIYSYPVGSNLFTGDRYSMQGRLSKQVVEYADKLYLDISRARDETFKKFPSIKDEFEKSKRTSNKRKK